MHLVSKSRLGFDSDITFCFHIDFYLGINPEQFLFIMLCLYASFHWPTFEFDILCTCT